MKDWDWKVLRPAIGISILIGIGLGVGAKTAWDKAKAKKLVAKKKDGNKSKEDLDKKV
jgi:hypothetical protein